MAKKNTPNLPPVPGDGESSGPGRREVAAQFARDQKRQARRRTILIQGAIGLIVVALVGVGTVVVLSQRDSGSDSAGSGGSGTPAGLTSDGAVRFGAADAPITLQAVEDFQCPICQQFEAANADLLESYRDGDDVAVEYRPIAFLDQMSSTDYSSRATNASMCVLDDSGQDAWLSYHEALYANQPAEGGAGLSDSDLVSMAEDAGAGDGVESCIEDRRFDDWVQQTTDAAFADGVTGTPTVFVNGTQLDGFDPATIEQAVTDAASS